MFSRAKLWMFRSAWRLGACLILIRHQSQSHYNLSFCFTEWNSCITKAQKSEIKLLSDSNQNKQYKTLPHWKKMSQHLCLSLPSNNQQFLNNPSIFSLFQLHYNNECKFKEKLLANNYNAYESVAYPGMYIGLSKNGKTKRGNRVSPAMTVTHFLPRI